MELQAIDYMASGLISVFIYWLWDRKIRRKYCSGCGQRISKRGKRLCSTCLAEMIEGGEDDA